MSMSRAALLGITVLAGLAQGPSADAAARVLAEARKAMGGETRQVAVKTIVASGRSRRLAGDNLVPVEFEINVQLPDRYVRKDEIPPQESTPSSSGFNGDELIQIPPPASRTAAPAAVRVLTIKQDFARLMLGMFANSFSSYPLTFAYVGKAEAPEGTAEVLEGKGAGSFSLRLFISSSTHLPIMVSWTAPAGRGAAASAAPVETRLYFSDYRESDGLRFPFRIRRAVGADTTEETTFDRVRINVKIDPRKFDVVK